MKTIIIKKRSSRFHPSLTENFTGKIINKNNNTAITYKNGDYHSFNDEPAYNNMNSGFKAWRKDGKRHRGNGKPALIYSGEQRHSEYWINHKQVNKEAAQVYALLFGEETEEEEEEENDVTEEV